MSRSLIEQLNLKTSEITKLKNQEQKRDNLVKQKKVDKLFETVVSDTGVIVDKLLYAKNHFSFCVDKNIYGKLQQLLESLPQVIVNDSANKEKVINCDETLKEIKKDTDTAWQVYYPSYVAETRNTLMIIGSLDNKASQCLRQIAQGIAFDYERLKALNKGMTDAEGLIEGLKLDADLKKFLQLMNSGQASLLDLDDKVRKWICDENLEGKIKLSFVVN